MTLLTQHSTLHEFELTALALIRSLAEVSDHPGTAATALTLAVHLFAAHQEDPRIALTVNVRHLAEQLIKLYPTDCGVAFTLRRLVELLDQEIRAAGVPA